MRHLIAWFTLASLVAAAPGDDQRSLDRDALRPLGPVVGAWRGAGQPKRMSAQGAWAETANWAWSIEKDAATLQLTVENGKLIRAATISRAQAPNVFRLELETPNGERRAFVSTTRADEKTWVFQSSEPVGLGDGIARISLSLPNENRLIMLLEGATENAARFVRIAEVGYTRSGVRFAAGDSVVECVVTGGRGTVPVTYEGKTYYVCCSGCKSAFEDDPKGILAEFAARKRAEADRRNP